jgi:HK97 family phage portal protein
LRLGLDLPVRPFPNGTAAKAVSSPLGAAASGVSTPEQKSGVQFFGASTGKFVQLLGGVPIDYEGFDFSTVRGRTAYVASCLAYMCIRYRVTKIIEAPLRVFEETKEGWKRLDEHELTPLLRRPNPDFGMKRHLEATEIYLLTTGRALWVKNRNRAKQVDSMYVFSGDDFTIERDKRKQRVFGEFRINGYDEPFAPEDVVFFQYFHPADPFAGLAPLDAALSHLNIGQTLLHRARHAVKNAFGAGVIYTMDEKADRLNDEDFSRLKSELNTGFQGANTGKAVVLEGGGKIEQGFTLQEIMVGELWRLVESGVTGALGIPPALVGTVIGLENSPWSHMPTAVNQFYDATIFPEWDFIAESITDQLLREIDDKPTRQVNFEWKDVRALQKDRSNEALIASTLSQIATVNERRAMVGLDQVTDEAANEIPELNRPDFSMGNETPDDDETEEEAQKRERKERGLRAQLFDAITHGIEAVTTLAAAAQLDRDRTEIVLIMESAEKAGTVPDDAKATPRQRVTRAQREAEAYLEKQSRIQWTQHMKPLLQMAARRAGNLIASDLSIDAALLNEDLLDYANREVGWLVKQVSETTRDSIRDSVRDGLEAGEGAREIAKRIRDLPAFNRERAMLVARTESTRVANGAPTEALQSFGKRTGQKFTKTWSAVGDERTRDEHAAMDGETVAIDAAFSNGLQAPGEPNCRCTLFYGVEN